LATTALNGALSIAERLGAVPLRRAVEDVARRARLPLAAGAANADDVRQRDGDHGLSEREVEVLGLVADGCTNREVAAALYISVRTAGVHVSHILTKLGVRNRSAAVAAARRLGVEL
jgi:DNA-binding NarL/FixJ family response regulator